MAISKIPKSKKKSFSSFKFDEAFKQLGITQLKPWTLEKWQNIQAGRTIDILGIVSNGQGWVFYKLNRDGQVLESVPYSLGDLPTLLGILHYIFQACEKNLWVST